MAQQPSDQTQKKFPGLVSLIGVAAAAVLVPTVAKWEGKSNTAYRDIVGVWTICYGDTRNVVPGMTQTNPQCDERLEQQLIDHAKPVLKCTPNLINRPNELVAAVSLAYNIGWPKYCKSTADRMFDAKRWEAGCHAIRRWNMAGGRVVKGLDNRRKEEERICLHGF